MQFFEFLFDHPGPDDVARAIDDVEQRFGADAAVEAARLAKVYWQLGSWRNLRLYQRAADELMRRTLGKNPGSAEASEASDE